MPKGYENAQLIFHDRLALNTALCNEYHALLVEHGKRHCQKKKPLCENCPLGSLCGFELKNKV